MNTLDCILPRDNDIYQNWLMSLDHAGNNWQQEIQRLHRYGAVLEPDSKPDTILDLSCDDNRLVFKSPAYLTLFKLQYLIPEMPKPCKVITIKPRD